MALTFAITTPTNAAKFAMSPNNDEFVQGCNSEINIMMNTEGKDSNAADIEVRYNPAQIEILDANESMPGIQIKNGTTYEAYFGNQVDTSSGTIKLAGASFFTPFNGTGLFATIPFKAKDGVDSSSFTIHFTGTGDTLDSNIAENTTSNDLLNGVTNGNYTFITGNCFPDTQPPNIIFQTPSSSSDTASEAEPTLITITDNRDGVDINTVVFRLNGKEYKPTNVNVTYSGDKMQYEFTVLFEEELPAGESSIIWVTAKDFAGNTKTRQLVFNYPHVEPPPPPEPGEPEEPEPCPECDCEEENVIGASYQLPLTGNSIKTIIETKTIKEVVKIPIVGPAIISMALLADIISLLMLLISPLIIFSLFNLLRKRKPYGLIYAIENHKGIKGTLVKIISEAGTIVTQTITDKNGRYGFLIEPGSYKISISHPDYNKKTIDIYVPEENSDVIKNISLLREEEVVEVGHSYLRIIRQLELSFQNKLSLLIYLGLFLSLISVIFNFSIINFLFLIVYSISFIFYIFNRIDDSRKLIK